MPEVDGLTMEGYRGHKDDSPEKRERFLAGQAVRGLKFKAPAADVAAAVKGKMMEKKEKKKAVKTQEVAR